MKTLQRSNVNTPWYPNDHFLFNNRVLFGQCPGAGLIQGKSTEEKESRNTPAPSTFSLQSDGFSCHSLQNVLVPSYLTEIWIWHNENLDGITNDTTLWYQHWNWDLTNNLLNRKRERAMKLSSSSLNPFITVKRPLLSQFATKFWFHQKIWFWHSQIQMEPPMRYNS